MVCSKNFFARINDEFNKVCMAELKRGCVLTETEAFKVSTERCEEIVINKWSNIVNYNIILENGTSQYNVLSNNMKDFLDCSIILHNIFSNYMNGFKQFSVNNLQNYKDMRHK